MGHVLDNPAFSALISGNKNLSYGNEEVKYFSIEVSPFVALRDNSTDDFGQLYELIIHNNSVIFIAPGEMEIPGQWKVLRCIRGLQMVYHNTTEQDNKPSNLVPLTTDDVPQMLALTKLTNPGPFATRTIEFGHYHGIFIGDQLVAMAGQRLHAFNYAEISAVCTHPDYTGKGYARQLLLFHISRILGASNIPFLHVRDDNERAIKLYETLGFITRRSVYFYVLQKV